MSEQNKEFSFGWLALKLLGKSLYSNAWSAISELVANGFDAQAEKVYVYIDATNKKNASVEIFDNGTGINKTGIDIYTRVGFNRRQEMPSNLQVMGRKGIGKLAALYLSENYILLTKTKHEFSSWKMEYVENNADKEQKPFLKAIDTSECHIVNGEIWDAFDTGTMLKLNNVNLAGLGDEAFDALSKKLSNYFSLDCMGDKQILLFIKKNKNEAIVFEPVIKEIAFKNMAYIEYNPSENFGPVMEEISAAKEHTVRIPYKKIVGDYSHITQVSEFEKLKISGKKEFMKADGEIIEKEFELKGWVGIHSSIDKDSARANDIRFTKSAAYNPIQLRLYVRNKLAVENFLTVLHKTQAFVNYIEGEVHFDILDDDDLPDIATSNRQNMDEHDTRIGLLKDMLSHIITQLIGRRNYLSDKMKEEEEKILGNRRNIAKRIFSNSVNEEVNRFEGLTENQKNELSLVVTNKIIGDVTPKSEYRIFLSHSRKDKIITDFFYQILKHKGVEEDEIFYTSKDCTMEQYDNLSPLERQIRECIIEKNTMLIYFTSKAYKKSEYCLFEGGAGWATRAVGEYLLFPLTFKEIPDFLTNRKLEFSLENAKKIELNKSTYTYLVGTLNKMISHINQARILSNEALIDLFELPNFPNELEMQRRGLSIESFFNKDIVDYWEFYIAKHLDRYIKQRHPVPVSSKNLRKILIKK